MILTQYVHSTVLDSKHKALLDTYYNMSKSNDTFSLPWFRCNMLYHVRKHFITDLLQHITDC